MILPSTGDATGGICMPCKNATLVPAATTEREEDWLTISFTICPHRGGFSKVYQLTHKPKDDTPIIRYQNGRGLPAENHPLRVGFHKIFEGHPYTENAVEPEKYQEIVSHLDGLSLPVIGGATGGFDGTDYALEVRNMMTSIEYRWWLDLPKEWKRSLTPVVKTLAALTKAEQGAGDQLPTRADSKAK